jgi:hypothetical protein
MDYLTIPLRKRLAARKEKGEDNFRKYAPAYGGIWTNEGDPNTEFAASFHGIQIRNMRYCDEVATRINHRGWFTDGYDSWVYRGVVFNLPHGKFGIGLVDGDGKYWNEPLLCRESYDDEIRAAHAADEEARVAADEAKDAAMKEHSEEAIEEIRGTELPNVRQAIVDLCKGIKESTLHPAACAGLKRQLRSLLEEKAELWKRIAKLEKEPWSVYPH